MEIALGSGGSRLSQRVWRISRNVACWAATAAAAYLALGLLLGNESYSLFWKEHAEAPSAAALRYAFSPSLVWDHTEAVWSAAAGVALLIRRKQLRRLAVPLTWLLTAAVVALEHRPWWFYYYLHLGIPLAWLSGIGVAGLLQLAWSKASSGIWRLRFLGPLVTGSALVSLIATEGGPRLALEVERLRDLPRVQDSRLVATMRRYAAGTHWVYTRFSIYPFHARLLVVPELAVLPLKRYWAGLITGEEIVATIARRKPEQLLLPAEDPVPALRQLLISGYTLVYEDGNLRLYVATRLVGA